MSDRFQHNGVACPFIRVAFSVVFLGALLFGTAHAADTIVPSAPSAPAATTASATKIWNASIDDVGVTGYRIDRCTGSSCTAFTQMATRRPPVTSIRVWPLPLSIGIASGPMMLQAI